MPVPAIASVIRGLRKNSFFRRARAGIFPRVLTAARRTWRRFRARETLVRRPEHSIGTDFWSPRVGGRAASGEICTQDFAFGRGAASDRGVCDSSGRGGNFPGNLSLRREQTPGGIAATRNYARSHVRLRNRAALVCRCLRVCSDDRGVHTHTMAEYRYPRAYRVVLTEAGTFVPEHSVWTATWQRVSRRFAPWLLAGFQD